MLWLIVVIIIVGYFIVVAIQRNSADSAAIAQKQLENSPVYQERYLQSVKRLDMGDRHLEIRERATRADEQLAQPNLTKKEIQELEKQSAEIYKEMNANSSKYHRDNENKPYYNQVFTENESIAYRWNELQRIGDELSERSRIARMKREKNYPKKR